MLLPALWLAAAATTSPWRMPDDVVVLTFGDAVRSAYTTVAPLLEQYGFGAMVLHCGTGVLKRNDAAGLALSRLNSRDDG